MKSPASKPETANPSSPVPPAARSGPPPNSSPARPKSAPRKRAPKPRLASKPRAKKSENPQSENAAKPGLFQKNGSLPRVRLAEAFRLAGIDEHAVASCYVLALNKLTGGRGSEVVAKLLIDVLKECTRVLESPRSSAAGTPAADDESPRVVVTLQHAVPRPVRANPALPSAPAPPDTLGSLPPAPSPVALPAEAAAPSPVP